MISKVWPKIFSLENKVVVVTGAGLIGTALIKGIAEAGANVIIAEVNEQVGKKLEIECKKNELKVIFSKMDISSEKSIDVFISYILEEFQKVDGWVNTAYPRTGEWGKRDQLLNYKLWIDNVDKHLGGYYYTSIKAAEIMKHQQKGSIVNFGSIYGVSAPDFSIYEDTDMTTPIPYVAIKGGINMLTKYIATYYGKFNVRANVIAPGGVFNNQPEPFVSNYIKKTPLNRMASPEDIIGPVIFLLSDSSSYITGHILLVDGGWTAW